MRLVVFFAVRRLSLDFIGELRGLSVAGQAGAGGVVDSAPRLKEHLTALLGLCGGREAAAIGRIVDDLIEAKGLPRRIDLRGQGGALKLQGWLDGLH